MDCSAFRKALDSYANLSELQKNELSEHACVCEECQRELDFFNSITQTAASVPFIEPPKDLLKLINERIDNESDDNTAGVSYKFRTISKRYAALAACIVLGLTVGLNSDVINDKINGGDNEGVISSSVTESKSPSVSEGDTREIETELPTAVPEKPDEQGLEENAAVSAAASSEQPAVSAPTASPNKVQNKVKQPVANSNPTSAPSANRKTSSASGKTAYAPSVSANSNTPAANNTAPVSSNSEALSVKQDSVPDSTASPSATQAAASSTAQPESENGEIQKYTIQRDSYHVPEEQTAQNDVQDTDQSDVQKYSLATDSGRVAYGYYEKPASERVVTRSISDYIIVPEASIEKVVAIMNELGVMSSAGLYMASRSNFFDMLSRLEAENIEYNYSLKYSSGDKISFKILLN